MLLNLRIKILRFILAQQARKGIPFEKFNKLNKLILKREIKKLKKW